MRVSRVWAKPGQNKTSKLDVFMVLNVAGSFQFRPCVLELRSGPFIHCAAVDQRSSRELLGACFELPHVLELHREVRPRA